MNNTELKSIYGGVSFSQGILNAIVKGVSTVYDIGRRIGSAISRLVFRKPLTPVELEKSDMYKQI